jgi:hypothetical protein
VPNSSAPRPVFLNTVSRARLNWLFFLDTLIFIALGLATVLAVGLLMVVIGFIVGKFTLALF